MSFSFQKKVASRSFYVLKDAIWENVKMGEEISVHIEANKASRKIDSYCCAMISIKLERSGHIPREVSRNVFIGKDGERADGSVLSIRYRSSLNPIGVLEMDYSRKNSNKGVLRIWNLQGY